jgi:hypothetical protein
MQLVQQWETGVRMRSKGFYFLRRSVCDEASQFDTTTFETWTIGLLVHYGTYCCCIQWIYPLNHDENGSQCDF